MAGHENAVLGPIMTGLESFRNNKSPAVIWKTLHESAEGMQMVFT